MTVKILQGNDRVAEVQFLCDCCGKLIKTSLITKEELEVQKNEKVMCFQCKNLNSTNNKN